MPDAWAEFWKQSLAGDFRKYYENTVRPACRKKWRAMKTKIDPISKGQLDKGSD